MFGKRSRSRNRSLSGGRGAPRGRFRSRSPSPRNLHFERDRRFSNLGHERRRMTRSRSRSPGRGRREFDRSGRWEEEFVPEDRGPIPPPIFRDDRIQETADSTQDRGLDQRDIREDRLTRLENLVERLVTNNTSCTFGSNQEELFLPQEGRPQQLIPRNTKFTTSMWLNQIEEESMEKNYDERMTIELMASRMCGIVKAWYKSISSYDLTWPELKMLIINTFPDNFEFSNTLELLVMRKKRHDETMTQYFFSKMYLLEACCISGQKAVSCLIHGLTDPRMRDEARQKNFLTPESLFSLYLSHCTDYSEEGPLRLDPPPAYLNNSPGRHRKEGRILHEEGGKNKFVNCEINGTKVNGYVDKNCSYVILRKDWADILNLSIKPCSKRIQGPDSLNATALGEAKVNLKIDLVTTELSVLIVPTAFQKYPLIVGQPVLNDPNNVVIIQEEEIRIVDNKLLSSGNPEEGASSSRNRAPRPPKIDWKSSKQSKYSKWSSNRGGHSRK